MEISSNENNIIYVLFYGDVEREKPATAKIEKGTTTSLQKLI
jgi:hypothetical protein